MGFLSGGYSFFNLSGCYTLAQNFEGGSIYESGGKDPL